jgi:predicted permease
MSRLRQLVSRLRSAFSGRSSDSQLHEELQSHFEMLVDLNLQRGLSPAEARRAARLSLGGAEQIREAVRDRRGLPFLESLASDLKFGARMLRKSPGFTAIAILTLALGIGANSAIFTLTYAVILKSLPVPNPQQLVRYTFRSGEQDLGLSGPAYDALRKHESSVEDLLAWANTEFAVDENGTTSKVEGALMSGNGFRVLELEPAIGRAFTDADDAPGGGPNGYQALISFNYWRDHFANRADIIGRPLNINGKSATIVGVLPKGFEGIISGQHADLVLPFAFEAATNPKQPRRRFPGSFSLTIMGRLKPGESLRSARSNLQSTEAVVREEADPSHRILAGFFSAFRIGVESGHSGRSSLKLTYGGPLLVLEVLVGLLMLLCCANTALLVLARVSSRTREFAVRSALGAPRGRLFRQVLSEIGLLSFFGLAAGIAFGWAGAQLLVSMITPVGQPSPLDVAPQFTILAFTAGITVFSALAAGTIPALRASRVSPNLGLKEGGKSAIAKTIGGWMVPSQVAVSVVLLTAASLLGGTLVRLMMQDSGFRTDHVVLADVELPSKLDTSAATRAAQQTADALSQMPGIEAAAVMNLPPIHDWFGASHYFARGSNGAVHSDMNVWGETVTPAYFTAMGTPLLEGRAFTPADVSGQRVCVLSESAARNFFPDEDAIGKFVYAGGADESADGNAAVSADDTFRVVGIAEDAKFSSLRETAPRMLYHLAHADEIGNAFFIVARSSNSGVASGAIREAVRRVVPDAPQPDIYSFERLVAQHLKQERMLTLLSACFAGIALLLTVMGLYGLLARYVDLRTKEIGLRLALGARPWDALALVFRQGLRLVIIGTVAGIAASILVARLLKTLLFGVSASNPLIFVAVVAILLVVALLACWIPARRAMRVDPGSALRCE